MNIVILTGNEKRHEFFRKFIASNLNINVISTYCESNDKSLWNRTVEKISEPIELQHVRDRAQSESDFFDLFNSTIEDNSNAIYIKKGDINTEKVVRDIIASSPDLLICYGSSIIKKPLLDAFRGRFLNVHLGLSPYYRGSGANIWPMINGELDMVGATFMYIDDGIDTGEIIHQIRADVHPNDTPHSIGNRLIVKMAHVYSDLVINFGKLKKEEQPENEGKLYLRNDFDLSACEKLYSNFSKGIVFDFLNDRIEHKYIVQNGALNK